MEQNMKMIKIECGVCWGGGLIEIDDFGNEEKCPYCKGKGFILKIEDEWDGK
jgi:uncharacterized CHY-type Zn-finger protein